MSGSGRFYINVLSGNYQAKSQFRQMAKWELHENDIFHYFLCSWNK